jgi:DNA-binding transcriptional ArsR family regulator
MSILRDGTRRGSTEASRESGESAPDRAARDQVFHILSNSRRRQVLSYLIDRGGSATKRGVSRHIAARENDVAADEVTPSMRKPVYIALHQTHIPRLEEEGLVRVNGQGTELTLTEDGRALGRYVEADGDDVPWSVLYLGLSAVSCATVAAAAVGVVPGSHVVWAAGIAGALTVTSVLYALSRRQPTRADVHGTAQRSTGTDRIAADWALVKRLTARLRDRVADRAGTLRGD